MIIVISGPLPVNTMIICEDMEEIDLSGTKVPQKAQLLTFHRKIYNMEFPYLKSHSSVK